VENKTLFITAAILGVVVLILGVIYFHNQPSQQIREIAVQTTPQPTIQPDFNYDKNKAMAILSGYIEPRLRSESLPPFSLSNTDNLQQNNNVFFLDWSISSINNSKKIHAEVMFDDKTNSESFMALKIFPALGVSANQKSVLEDSIAKLFQNFAEGTASRSASLSCKTLSSGLTNCESFQSNPRGKTGIGVLWDSSFQNSVLYSCTFTNYSSLRQKVSSCIP